jgi:hypothetical protein
MRRHALGLLSGTVALLLACASAGSQVPIAFSEPGAGAAASAEYVPIGEVIVRGRGATFSDTRVVGPTVNLTRNEDGSWAGSILGSSVALKPIAPGRLKGAGGDLHFVRWESYVLVQGMLGNRKVEVRYKPGPGHASGAGIVCDAAVATVDCTTAPTASGSAELKGRAAAPDAPMPQLGLTLLAAML